MNEINNKKKDVSNIESNLEEVKKHLSKMYQMKKDKEKKENELELEEHNINLLKKKKELDQSYSVY